MTLKMHQLLNETTTRQSRIYEPPKEHIQNDRHFITLVKVGLRETKRVGWKNGVPRLQLLQLLHERREEETTATTELMDRFCV